MTSYLSAYTLTALLPMHAQDVSGMHVSFLDFMTTYSYVVMTIGTVLIGIFSGTIGCFLYLRKQSLLSDVIGHSAIAGVMGAFVVATAVIGLEDGRSMLVLSLGAVVSSLLAVLIAEWVAKHTVLDHGATMAICLALFYGMGIVALHMITQSTLPNRGGLAGYMFGNAATITQPDVLTIATLGGISCLIVCVLWKEIKVYIFDPIYAHTLGFSSRLLTLILLMCATICIVIGVKAVGLILMVAFAIMPAASARQWTKTLSSMVVLAALIGGISAFIGCFMAVRMGKVPTGPVVVMILFAVFIVSLLCAPRRSLIYRAYAQYRHRLRERSVA